jgi:hypothetical protein
VGIGLKSEVSGVPGSSCVMSGYFHALQRLEFRRGRLATIRTGVELGTPIIEVHEPCAHFGPLLCFTLALPAAIGHVNGRGVRRDLA